MKIFRNVGSFIADIFVNRRLVLALTKKDVKRRYAGAIFGNLWSFVTPLLQIIVYWFVFGFGNVLICDKSYKMIVLVDYRELFNLVLL